ncbi:MAG: tail-specific protease, partial [Deltaproteobacteria bacterium]|nr:tail-specific protease [Deltaproteobacteria bacterium]
PDPDNAVLYGGPLVILTSRVSASASEILAGALKDYGRAVVVGDDHTFGKGTVQSLFPLRPGLGALKVTTGLFFRPGGTSTQHAGVAADVVTPSLFATDEFGESALSYSLRAPSIDSFLENGGHQEGWKPVSPEVVEEVVEELARRSETRQTSDEFFETIREELAKREASEGVVRLADLVAEREENGTDPLAANESGPAPGNASAAVPEEAKADDDKLTPHAEEALRVLGDLILLSK